MANSARSTSNPKCLRPIEIAVAIGLNEPPERVLGDDLLGGPRTHNTVRQPAQPLCGLALLGAAAVVDDLDLGTLALGVPEILGQLQVGEHRAVSALLPRFAQIHVSEYTCIRRTDKALSSKSMYLGFFARTCCRLRITYCNHDDPAIRNPRYVLRHCQSGVGRRERRGGGAAKHAEAPRGQ